MHDDGSAYHNEDVQEALVHQHVLRSRGRHSEQRRLSSHSRWADMHDAESKC